MTYDIKVLKHLGYNMLRKHVKVEPALYYAAADELGILIMQDMPNLATQRWPNEAEQVEFQRQLEVIVTQLRSYESLFSWVSNSQTPQDCDLASFLADNSLNIDDLQRRMGPDYILPPRVRFDGGHQNSRSHAPRRRCQWLARPRRWRLPRQSPLCRCAVRHTLGRRQHRSFRPFAHWLPGRVRRPRAQCFGGASLEGRRCDQWHQPDVRDVHLAR